jgi:hypothetical protein
MINQTILECKRVKFYSSHDKDAFFEWLKKISCITSVEGKGEALFITINNKKVSSVHLRDVTSLFRRYKLDLSQLEILLNDKNKTLFRSYKYGYSICVYPMKK